jgi:transcriptional regulator with XRE-family HTH domain
MELNFSAEKLITLRKLQGLSQDKLAEKAGINIRTLQRIEKKEVRPQPHTLGQLSTALGATIDDFCNFEVEKQISLLHFSALAGSVFPLANIIVPYLVWVFKKEPNDAWNIHARQVLNFQISWSLYLALVIVLYFTVAFFAFLVFTLPLITAFSIILCPVYSGFRSIKNKPGFYPLLIKFLN